jgi:hypothetical protein
MQQKAQATDAADRRAAKPFGFDGTAGLWEIPPEHLPAHIEAIYRRAYAHGWADRASYSAVRSACRRMLIAQASGDTRAEAEAREEMQKHHQEPLLAIERGIAGTSRDKRSALS